MPGYREEPSKIWQGNSRPAVTVLKAEFQARHSGFTNGLVGPEDRTTLITATGDPTMAFRKAKKLGVVPVIVNNPDFDKAHKYEEDFFAYKYCQTDPKKTCR